MLFARRHPGPSRGDSEYCRRVTLEDLPGHFAVGHQAVQMFVQVGFFNAPRMQFALMIRRAAPHARACSMAEHLFIKERAHHFDHAAFVKTKPRANSVKARIGIDLTVPFC